MNFRLLLTALILPVALATFDAGEIRCAEPSGRLKVRVTDEAGTALPVRVHLRDQGGRAILPPGAPSQQTQVWARTEPLADDWFYCQGGFQCEVPAGTLDLALVHGFRYDPVVERVEIAPGGTIEKSFRMSRLAGPEFDNWYSGDEHIHRQLPAGWMLAEELNVAFSPVCQVPLVEYRQLERVEQTPDAQHLTVIGPAIEWDCFLWGLRQPLVTRLDGQPWPDGAIDPDAARPFQSIAGNPFISLSPFVVEQAHRDGLCVVAYAHNHRRLGFYPLYAAHGWIDVYGVLENRLSFMGHVEDEARRQRFLDDDFAIWYRLLNCGFRLPASAGSDNIAAGNGLWPGHNRVYARVEGEFTLANWIAAVKAGRSFVTNRPLLFVRLGGHEPGAELHVASGAETGLRVQGRVLSATPIERIEIVANGELIGIVEPPAPATDVRFDQPVPLDRSAWLAVRCWGRGTRRNAEPKYAFAHSSPFYVLVDGAPIQSGADARFLRERLSEYLSEALPAVTDQRVRRALEEKSQQALDVYRRQETGAGQE